MTETVETHAPVEPAAAPAAAPTDTQEVAVAHRDGEETPTPEVSHATTLALLQAELDSVVKSMSDLVKVKEEDQITLYEPKDPESGEVDVAKERYDVLVKIQHDLKRQQEVQRATLTSQFLLGKMQETMSKFVDREVEWLWASTEIYDVVHAEGIELASVRYGSGWGCGG